MEVEGVGSVFERDYMPGTWKELPPGKCLPRPDLQQKITRVRKEPGFLRNIILQQGAAKQPHQLLHLLSSWEGFSCRETGHGYLETLPLALGYLPQEANSWPNLSSSHCSTARS